MRVHAQLVEHLLSVDDLHDVGIDDVVRLALLVHDRPSALATVLEGATVGMILPAPRAPSTKVRLHSAVNRLGASALEVEPRGRGLPPPVEDVVDELRAAVPRACVVAGPSLATVRVLARRVEVPTFYAGDHLEDPWVVLAGHVAVRLVAANRERGAVDGFEEMRREAMVPTAAAIIALLAGCPVPNRRQPTIDLRTESASNWFG